MILFIFLVLSFAPPAFGQSSYTVTTTAQQDAALLFWLSDKKAGENGQAVITQEDALQFIVDRSLRRYVREVAEREDKRGLGDTLAELATIISSSPTAQAKIKEVVTGARPENRAKIVAILEKADPAVRAALASMFGLVAE